MTKLNRENNNTHLALPLKDPPIRQPNVTSRITNNEMMAIFLRREARLHISRFKSHK
jgi:hypothetical protein